MPSPLPILILAGSDRRSGPLPPGMTREEMLSGFKGARPLPNGRCLAGELIERVRDSGPFADPILLGPQQVYGDLVDCEVVSVEGNLPMTLAVLRDLLRHRFDPLAPVAICACDVLPAAEELRELMRTGYEPMAGALFWGEFIVAEPTDMGASSWKPAYAFRPTPSDAPLNMYPGHLFVVRGGALRMRLTNHLLQLAYRHRNLELRKRLRPMILRGLGRLIIEDFRNLFRLQAPSLAVGIPYHCLRAYRKYRRGELSVADFCNAVAQLLLHRDYRRAATFPPVQFALTPLVSFAKDLDTEVEMQELLANGI